MPSSTSLDELFRSWRAARDRGEPTTPTELCRDCPELLPDLLRLLQSLEAVSPPTRSPDSLDPSATRPEDTVPATELRVDAEPLPGYRLVRRLGKGGFGEVWEALAPGGFRVAFKFVALEGRAGAVELQALEIIRNLRHPNLLTVFGTWQAGGQLIIGMELADATLFDELKKADGRGQSGLPRKPLVRWSQDAARVIDYLNKPRHFLGGSKPVGIQHGDIKPQNILLVGQGVKVGDFGLVRLLRSSMDKHDGGMTPLYAAPEVFAGQVSRWSDQYSLAVTWCQLRGGKLPYTGASVSEIRHKQLELEPDLTMLPEEERPVVARALARDPRGRWPDCRAFIKELAASQVKSNTATPPVPAQPMRQGPLRAQLEQPAPTAPIAAPKAAPVIRGLPPVPSVVASAPPASLSPPDAVRKPVKPPRAESSRTAPPPSHMPGDRLERQMRPPPPMAPSARPWPTGLVVALVLGIAILTGSSLVVLPLALTVSAAGGIKPSAAAGDIWSSAAVGLALLWVLAIVTWLVRRSRRQPGRQPQNVAPIHPSPPYERSTGLEPASAVEFELPPGETSAPRKRGTTADSSSEFDLVLDESVQTRGMPAPGAVGASAGSDSLLELSVSDSSLNLSRSKTGAVEPFYYRGHTDAVWAVAVSPGGGTFLSGGMDHTVCMWSLRTRELLRSFIGHTDGVTALAFASDSRSAISASLDGTLREWSLEGGPEKRRMEGHAGRVLGVAYSPDGKTLASCGEDGVVRLWDVESGAESRRLEGHAGWVHAVAFADDQRLLSAGADGTVRMWDVANGTEMQQLTGHTGPVRCLAVNAAGIRAVSGSEDNSVILWNLHNGMEMWPFRGHTDWVRAVAWLPDGRHVAIGSDDETLCIWDSATEKVLHRFDSTGASVLSLAVTADGRFVLAGSDDQTVRQWELPGFKT